MQLGSPSNPWQLTASIYFTHFDNYGHANLLGNVTVPFIHGGCANFTNLAIDILDSDVILEFHVTYPNTSTLSVRSAEFSMEARDYRAVVVEMPGEVFEGEGFGLTIEMRDGAAPEEPADGFDQTVKL